MKGYSSFRFRTVKQKTDMKLRQIIIAITGLLLCIGCEERNPALFEDMSGVYFNNRSATMRVVDSLDITFVYEKEDYVDVPVKIQLLGRPEQYDRPVSVSVHSDNASEGVDFTLPQEPVMPAGSSEADYVVKLLRTDALKSERKSVSLAIHANEHFELPVFDIFFSDMFTKAPAAWDENLIGKFTQQKFELICDVLDMDPADFNDASVITLAKLLYISSEMTSYVKGEAEKKAAGLPYDENAFDPQTGLPLEFGR